MGLEPLAVWVLTLKDQLTQVAAAAELVLLLACPIARCRDARALA